MPKIVRRGASLSYVAIALAATALFSAGCEDECKVGTSKCVSGSIIRTCIPTKDGNVWASYPCGDQELCVSDVTGLNGDGGTATGDSGVAMSINALNSGSILDVPLDGPSCVGNCLQGERKCVNDVISSVCINDGVWSSDPCAVGEKCTDGLCAPSNDPGAVKACVPGTKACSGDKAEKVCDADGLNWTVTACLPSESCQGDECKADPQSSCDDGNSCLDAKHALRCQGEAEGFLVVECPGDTYCELGVCRGANCALGSTCGVPFVDTNGAARATVTECTDGVNLKTTVCGENEQCQTDKDTAKCVPRECKPGAAVCGDPRDPKVDPTTNYTTCVTAAPPPVGSGLSTWVTGTCEGGATCNPATIGGGTPCTQNCTPGTMRCATANGIQHGTQTCDKDGNWSPVVTCNKAGESEKHCMISPNLVASELPVAVCAEPICDWVFESNWGDGSTGYCEDGKLRKCLPDGTIAKAADCDQGVCTATGATAGVDGRIPGACQTTPQCAEGQTQCVLDSGAGSLFQTCEAGFWSTKLNTCPTDGTCWNVVGKDNGPSHQCGGECAAGTRQCDATDLTGKKIQTCDKDGKWAAGVACTVGTCSNIGNNDAGCHVQCVPGDVQCTGSFVTSSDGAHTGRSESQTCGADGTWGAATACAGTTTCRTGASGEDIGCVECVGEDVPGGNEESVTDTRCDPAAAAKLQECGPDNKWKTSRACAGGTTCTGGATCGSCWSWNGVYGVCSEARINDGEQCGSCDVALTAGGPTTITNCTQTAIAATANASSTTCAGQGFGTPIAWAGFADCCDGYQYGTTYDCSDLGDVPVAAGATADCCDSYVTGSTLAYCGTP